MNTKPFSYIEAKAKYGSLRKAAKALGIPKSTFFDRLKAEEQRLKRISSLDCPLDKRQRRGKKVFFITSAQNNTEIYHNFLKSLETYKKWYEQQGISAEILVVPITYWNLFESQKEGEPEWDASLQEYLVDKRCILHDDLILCGEMDINPTAVNPLSGLDNYVGNRWGIFAHPKVALRSYPTFKGQPARQLMTTGAITRKNYIPKKTGMKAHFHHVVGAVLVEVDYNSGNFWVRHVLGDEITGEFYDLNRHITVDSVHSGVSVPAVVFGDIHAEKVDKDAFSEAIRLSKGVGAKQIVLHDLIDFWARSHHTINDSHERFRIHVAGMDNVETAFQAASMICQAILEHAECEKVVIVDSNHHTAFEKWLNTADYKNDPINAVFFLKSQLHFYECIQRGIETNIFEDVLRKHIPSWAQKSVVFLDTDESYIIEGIEVGVHGHLGSNGARGTPSSFAKLGMKSITGHTHSPSIIEGVYTVGCLCQMNMGYNKGPSSWSHTVCLIYPNGKRCLVNLDNGKYAMLRIEDEQK